MQHIRLFFGLICTLQSHVSISGAKWCMQKSSIGVLQRTIIFLPVSFGGKWNRTFLSPRPWEQVHIRVPLYLRVATLAFRKWVMAGAILHPEDWQSEAKQTLFQLRNSFVWDKMTGCCAVGCTNRPEKGYKMHCLPADDDQRKKWLSKISRHDRNKNLEAMEPA